MERNVGNIVAPDGGYGWVIVGATFFNDCIVCGHMMCFSMFYYEIAEYFQVSLAYAGLIQSVASVFSFFPGENVDNNMSF